ncbi:unnamed protein product, partial [Prorocentrum cordatum]
ERAQLRALECFLPAMRIIATCSQCFDNYQAATDEEKLDAEWEFLSSVEAATKECKACEAGASPGCDLMKDIQRWMGSIEKRVYPIASESVQEVRSMQMDLLKHCIDMDP